MADNMEAKVKISAEIDGLRKGLEDAQAAVNSAAKSINDAMSGMSPTVKPKVETGEFKSGMNDAKDSAKSASGSISESMGDMAKSMLKVVSAIEIIKFSFGQLKSAIDIAGQFEQMQIGIAAVIGASSENVSAMGVHMNATQKFALAQSEAEEALKDLRKANLETIATLPEITEAFQSALAPARSFGLSIQQTVGFTKDMANAAAAIGMPMNQLSQEIRAVLEGDTSRNSRVNQILQITPAIIEAHRAAGDLGEYLHKRLEDYAVAGDAMAKSWVGIKSNIEDAIIGIKAKAAEDVFGKMKEDGLDLQKYLTDNADNIAAVFSDAFNDIYIFGKQAFELIQIVWTTFFDTVNGLIKIFVDGFTGGMGEIDSKAKQMSLFDYFMLGLITITEGVRQLVDAFKLGIVVIGDMFHSLWENIYAGYAWVVDKIAAAQKALGIESEAMTKYQAELHQGLNDTRKDGLVFIQKENELIGDMKKGVDRLSDSYNKMTAAKEESKKKKTDDGSKGSTDHTVAKPPTPKEQKEDRSAERAAKKEFEEELAQIKLDRIQKEGKYDELSKDDEVKFWQSKLAIAKEGGVKMEGLAKEIETKILNLKAQGIKEDFNKEIEALKVKADLDKNNLKLKADVYAEIFEKIKAHYATDTKEYRQALQNKLDAQRQYELKSIEIESDLLKRKAALQESELNIEQNNLETFVQMGVMTENQKLEKFKEIEQRRYEIKKSQLEQELKLYDKEPDKVRQINGQIDALNNAHSQKMAAISNQLRAAMYAPFKSMVDGLENQFANALTKMMQGTLTFSSFVKGILPAIGQAFMAMAAQMAAKWLFEHTVMKAISAIFAGEEAATTAAVTAEQIAASKIAAAGQIPALTQIGAMGAFSAMAAIPVVGPALGMAAWDAAQALGASSLAIASASGGFDIGAGVNPITQLHEQEMVLPAHIANPLRDSLANGGIGGGTTINIHAVDAKSVKQLFMDHGSALVQSLQKQNRAFARA